MSRFGTLRWRLTALYAAVAAVMLIVVLAIGGAVVETALLQSTAERLEIEAGLVVADATGGRRGPRAPTSQPVTSPPFSEAKGRPSSSSTAPAERWPPSPTARQRRS